MGEDMIYKELHEWIITLPYWQQKIAEQIFSEKAFDERDYCNIYKIFKEEMGLSEIKLVTEPIILPKVIDEKDVENSLSWKGVKEIRGINALKCEEKLEISSLLTLVYGENGSGKSGYTRLFNNAFVSKGDKSLIHNVFKDRHEEEYAKFIFEKAGNEFYLEYPKEKDAEEFNRIMVFDTASAYQDMQSESELSFVPSEFRFFEKLLDVCYEIQNRLVEEIQKRDVENNFLVFFEKKNEIYDYIKNLAHDTQIELIHKYDLLDEEKVEMEVIKKEKAKLVSLNLKEKVDKLNVLISENEKIKNLAKSINDLFSNNNLTQIKELIQNLNDAVILSQSEGLAQFKDSSIEKVGSHEWKGFLLAAQKYYKSIGHEVDVCIFCGQDIKDIDLIDKYWKYLNSMAEKNYHFLENNLNQKVQLYETVSMNLIDKTSVYGEWLNSNNSNIYEQLKDQTTKLNSSRQKIINALNDKKWDICIIEECIDLNLFEEILIDIEKQIKKLNSEEIEKQINEMDEKEQLFKDRTKIIQLLPQIETFILDKKWVFNAERKKIKTRNITSKQKDLFSRYVTEDYIKAFNEECLKLNANFQAEIIQRGSKGVTLKKIAIKGMMPGKILSEGEQRAICISNFLAEVKMNPQNIGVIFDDPVSSLDHKRRRDIAERLVSEAMKRQIVIFTHDITFLMEIKSICENQKVDMEMQTIRKICDEPGDISKVIPWQGLNVGGRIKKLNAELQELNKLEKDGLIDEYFYRAKAWCELLRESWERSVEEVLLNDAIQRYNPCVQTQRLAKAPFSIALYDEVERGMTECSKWVHDRARELNADAPKAKELKEYIDIFSGFVKSNRP
jgi:energy-coupling factor transporter ATP-binding protein EcfA2